jgi:hypothetical protein
MENYGITLYDDDMDNSDITMCYSLPYRSDKVKNINA